MSENVTLFATNGDGTVDCSWCGETFDADLASPNDNDEPICPECYEASEDESAEMTRAEYIENLHSADSDLTAEQLETEADKWEKWKASR